MKTTLAALVLTIAVLTPFPPRALAAGASPSAASQAPSKASIKPSIKPSIKTENGRVVLEGALDASERRQRVRTWYRRWRREITPVLRAAGLVERVLRDEHRSKLPGACRILGRALLDFDRPHRWPAPDYALHRHLKDHLDHLTRAATACLTDRRTATGAELRRAREAQSQAALVWKQWVE